MVEQRNHNPLVRGPNPFAATKISQVSGIFYFTDFVSKFTTRAGFLHGSYISLTRNLHSDFGAEQFLLQIVFCLEILMVVLIMIDFYVDFFGY